MTQLNSASRKPKTEEERSETLTNLETGTSLELCLHHPLYPFFFFNTTIEWNRFLHLILLIGKNMASGILHFSLVLHKLDRKRSP